MFCSAHNQIWDLQIAIGSKVVAAILAFLLLNNIPTQTARFDCQMAYSSWDFDLPPRWHEVWVSPGVPHHQDNHGPDLSHQEPNIHTRHYAIDMVCIPEQSLSGNGGYHHQSFAIIRSFTYYLFHLINAAATMWSGGNYSLVHHTWLGDSRVDYYYYYYSLRFYGWFDWGPDQNLEPNILICIYPI